MAETSGAFGLSWNTLMDLFVWDELYVAITRINLGYTSHMLDVL